MCAMTWRLSWTLAVFLLESPPSAETVFLKDGRMLQAHVLEVRRHEVLLEYQADGSTVRAGFPRKQIDPHSFYLLFRERIAPGDGGAHRELARLCRARSRSPVRSSTRSLPRARSSRPSTWR